MGFSREFSGSIANAGEHAVNDSKLRWQCRRGMRELDLLLTDYLENDGNADAACVSSICC